MIHTFLIITINISVSKYPQTTISEQTKVRYIAVVKFNLLKRKAMNVRLMHVVE